MQVALFGCLFFVQDKAGGALNCQLRFVSVGEWSGRVREHWNLSAVCSGHDGRMQPGIPLKEAGAAPLGSKGTAFIFRTSHTHVEELHTFSVLHFTCTLCSRLVHPLFLPASPFVLARFFLCNYRLRSLYLPSSPFVLWNRLLSGRNKKNSSFICLFSQIPYFCSVPLQWYTDTAKY